MKILRNEEPENNEVVKGEMNGEAVVIVDSIIDSLETIEVNEPIEEKESSELVSCSLEDLLFEVEMIDNPVWTNSEYSKIITAIIDGKVKHLNYCSGRYELIKNVTIFPEVEKIFNDLGIAFSVEYSHANNVRFYAKYTIEDERFHYKMEGTEDVIKFSFFFQHSYNGKTKFKGVAGFYRLVCTNGLTVPVAEMSQYNLSISGKHTEAILRSLLEFKNLLNYVAENLGEVTKAITERYETLNVSVPTDPRKRVEEVLKAAGIAAIENSKFNTVNYVMNRITTEMDSTELNGSYDKVNDWLIYNGINHYINNDSLNVKAPETRNESDSKVLEYMLKTAA
jgi:hypothetical protein